MINVHFPTKEETLKFMMNDEKNFDDDTVTNIAKFAVQCAGAPRDTDTVAVYNVGFCNGYWAAKKAIEAGLDTGEICK